MPYSSQLLYLKKTEPTYFSGNFEIGLGYRNALCIDRELISLKLEFGINYYYCNKVFYSKWYNLSVIESACFLAFLLLLCHILVSKLFYATLLYCQHTLFAVHVICSGSRGVLSQDLRNEFIYLSTVYNFKNYPRIIDLKNQQSMQIKNGNLKL